MLLANTFFGLHELARQMETLFGEEKQCLPLDAISRFVLFYILWSKLRFPLSLSTSFVTVATYRIRGNGRYSQTHVGWHFRMLFQSSKPKARTSLFLCFRQKRRSSFQLAALKNVTPNGIGCTASFCLFVCLFHHSISTTTFGFWILVCYADTQLVDQLQQTRIQVVRSNRVARKRPAESNGTPAMDSGHMIIDLTYTFAYCCEEDIRIRRHTNKREIEQNTNPE